ncbi:MAG: large conductance mechanosensitive channel protein MscL [Clostridia bacterium]|nr:large conductance mechanosensitive channel protein MscL [Clostridia bacterium]
MVKEFKDFIMRGNVMDLAIGVVIGGAFKAIIDSLVGDIIMPFVGMITGKINIASLSVKVGEAELKYGSFLQQIINFLIIAFVIFAVVKGINTAHEKLARKKKEEEKEEEDKPSTEDLLTEIRDLLKEKK